MFEKNPSQSNRLEPSELSLSNSLAVRPSTTEASPSQHGTRDLAKLPVAFCQFTGPTAGNPPQTETAPKETPEQRSERRMQEATEVENRLYDRLAKYKEQLEREGRKEVLEAFDLFKQYQTAQADQIGLNDLLSSRIPLADPADDREQVAEIVSKAFQQTQKVTELSLSYNRKSSALSAEDKSSLNTLLEHKRSAETAYSYRMTLRNLGTELDSTPPK